MRSIGTMLDASRGLGQGFDFLRVALAFSVVTWHTPPLASGSPVLETTRFLWFGNYAILAVFFALSGFLITGSALRLSLGEFLVNRGMRIFPALIVEIVLSAFILGPMLTSLPLHAYLSDGQTWHYFTNVVGWINYFLPGVFSGHPDMRVNNSLWTVPFELCCYAIMSAFIIFGLLRKPWVVASIGMFILGVGFAMFLAGWEAHRPILWRKLLEEIFYLRGSRLFIAFTFGIAAYLFRYKLPYSWRWFAAALAICVVVAAAGHEQYPFPPVDVLTAAPLAYITAFLGVTALPRLPFFHRGDYSYGIYLYGWPVMQTMRACFPVTGGSALGLWAISLVPITLFAAFSWHTIEKPVLRLRRKFSFVARQRLAEAPPSPSLSGPEPDQPITVQASA